MSDYSKLEKFVFSIAVQRILALPSPFLRGWRYAPRDVMLIEYRKNRGGV